DEGQFFPDLAEAVCALVHAGKIVIVAALNGDYLRRPFGDTALLLPLASGVRFLCAICDVCHADAPFSARVSGGTSVVEIGGKDRYIALCGACYSTTSNSSSDSEKAAI